MLFADGVHRQRMLPLGVEKWQGIFKLFGPLHGKLACMARAPEAIADSEVSVAAPVEDAMHSAPTPSHAAERERHAARIIESPTFISQIVSHPNARQADAGRGTSSCGNRRSAPDAYGSR